MSTIDLFESEEQFGKFAEVLRPIAFSIGATPAQPRIALALTHFKG